MQPNTIAYAFDDDNDGGTTPAVNVALTRLAEELHKSSYRTADHNETVRTDTLSFYRTLPKRAGEFLGQERTAIKRTKTVTVPSASGTDTEKPIIVDLSFGIPVGVSEAEKTSILMELIGFLTSSEGKAAMLNLLKYQEI